MQKREKTFTRREMIAGSVKTLIAASILPHMTADALPATAPLRAINIMNFIRALDPRDSIDLMEPVREQMRLIKAHGFPATWLLQYDALVIGPYVDFLKSQMPSSHETGIWFEMNQRLCEDAGIPWRGKAGWEWDYHVPVDYAIGYTPDERRKLADTAMAKFRSTFGHEARSVGSWMIDAVTAAHLSDHYGVDAFGNCRDQLATDGFTIWGAPIAAYYPNRKNAYSPALSKSNQIATPMFRLLGQDPVYYYDKQISYPDTMEPAWPSGQSLTFVHRFLDMIAKGPTEAVAYAQLGQENSFGWKQMSKGYPMQMDVLAQYRRNGLVVETMGETGRRFKRQFSSTPVQAQVVLEDPFAHKDEPQRTVWYQSKYYRANLHFRGDSFFLRDLHVYNDAFPQIYLSTPTRDHYVQHRMLAVLDGYHWSDPSALAGGSGTRAMGQFMLADSRQTLEVLSMSGLPAVDQSGSTLRARVPLNGGGELIAEFYEREIRFRLKGAHANKKLGLQFDWLPSQSAFQSVSGNCLNYRFRDFNYSVRVSGGNPSKTANGIRIIGEGSSGLGLLMAQ